MCPLQEAHQEEFAVLVEYPLRLCCISACEPFILSVLHAVSTTRLTSDL